MRPTCITSPISSWASRCLLVTLFWTFTGCSAGTPDSSAVVVVVNGKAITQREFEARWAELSDSRRAFYEQEGGRSRFLDDLITRELLLQEARRMGVDRSQTLRDQVERAKEQMIIAELTNQVLGSRVEVSDAELETYLGEHKDALPQQVEIRTAQILVDKEPLARELKRQLDRGGDFAKLAARHSLDKGTRAQGGDQGVFHPGTIDPEIETQIANLAIGVVSDPIKTASGYHLVKVTKREEPDPKLVQTAREQLQRELTATKRLKQYQAFLEKLRSTAVIRQQETLK